MNADKGFEGKPIEKPQPIELSESDKRLRTYLVGLAFVLFVISLVGLIYLSTTPLETVSYALSFAAGLSMIILPCTFPLVFVIVPLSMGKGYKKGFLMAILFGVGLIITLALYGVVIAFAGNFLGLDRIAMILYLFAGILALTFGLFELKLIKFEFPTLKVGVPKFIQQQGSYLKAFFLGLFLGNAGIGCPNPATYVILTHIAATGNIFYGAALQAVNGVGRATPLIFLSILGILGVNATNVLVRRKDLIDKITGFGLIVIGAIIIVWGLFGHFWFLNTPLHAAWTRSFTAISGMAEIECCIEPACKMCPKGEWIYEKNTCQCRQDLEKGNLDRVCPECRKGLAEGKGVEAIAERTQLPAFGLLIALIALPVGWYCLKEKNRERKIGGEKNG